MEPESWEDFEDTSSRMGSLNINASSFVPSVGAAPFVPGGAPFVPGAAPFVSGAAPFVPGVAPFVPRFAQNTSDNHTNHTQPELHTNGHVYQPNPMETHSTDCNRQVF